MILHTIYPLDRVLQGLDDENGREYLDMEWNGVSMQVEVTGQNQARLVRLYHAPLHHYLNPSFAPGQPIEFFPVFR